MDLVQEGVTLPLDFLTSTSTAICNGRHAAWYGSLFNTLKKENKKFEAIEAYTNHNNTDHFRAFIQEIEPI